MATNFKDKLKNPKINRLLVVFAAISAFLALQYTYFSVYESLYDAGTDKYIYENIGTLFLVIFGLISFILSTRYTLYWVFFNKSEVAHADERQLSVRKRVYEKSYKLFAITALVAYIWFDHPDQRMQLIFWWFIGITFFAMPILVAAWQKDS